MKRLTLGRTAVVIGLMGASLVAASPAVAVEVENPRFIPPYPKSFHLGSAPERTGSSGLSPITFVAKSEGGGTEAVLTCNYFKGEGDVTGPKTLTTTLVMSGCHTNSSPAAKCSNTEKPGQIIVTPPPNGELGTIEMGSFAVGLRLEFNIEAVCKSRTTTYPLSIKGSAIGQIQPVNTRTNRFTVKFTRSGDEQVPPAFEGGPPTVLVSTVGTSPPEPTAVETTMFLKFPAATEIRE